MRLSFLKSQRLASMLLPRWVFDSGKEENKRVTQIGYSTVCIAIIFLVLFSALHFIRHEFLPGFVNLVFAAALAGVIFYHRKTKGPDHYAVEAGVFIFGCFSLYLVFSGNADQPTFLWFYVFPLVVMFIMGSHRGTVATILVSIPLMATLILDRYLPYIAQYSMGMKLRFIPSLLLVSGLSYLYARNRERTQERLNRTLTELCRSKEDIEEQVKDRTNQLFKANENLIKEMDERKQAQDILKESEKKYRELIDGMNETVWVIDFNGDLIDVNNTAVDVLGYSKEELLTIGLYGIDFSLKKDEIVALASAMPTDKLQTFETFHRTKEGRTFPVEVCSSLVTYQGKQAILSIARNITKRKQAEEALQKAYKDLQEAKDQIVQSEKLSAIGVLASGAAHEILNPLNILSLRLQMMQMVKYSEDELKKSFEICKNQIDRIVKIVGGMRKFSRTSEKKLSEKSIAEIIDNVLSLSAPRIKTEDVTTDVQYDPDLPLITMDEEAMKQVFFNLVSNALDAMKGREKRILRVSAERKESKVLINISDTGTGIKEEDFSKLFVPFFTTKGPDKGTGFGLSVSYRIIKDHNGRIWAENNEWGGATFFIEMPVGESSVS